MPEADGAGRRLSALSWVIAAGVTLGGCSSLPGGGHPRSIPPDGPVQVELTQVPYHGQSDFQCGPAALAMVLGYAGVARTPDELASQVYLPERHGSLQPEMLAAARRAGLVAFALAPDTGALYRELAAGHPVLVLQNLRFALLPQWHYAVVIGYDLPARAVILRSGAQQRLVVDEDDFEDSWRKAGYWAFVAVRPTQIPATATADDYAVAVADLERVSPSAAAEGYRAITDRWPDNLVAHIGLGNIAYGLHQLPAAQEHYRSATQAHPDSADAWNNLAQVLHELGQDGPALDAARRAVALGGLRSAEYGATLEAIGAGATH